MFNLYYRGGSNNQNKHLAFLSQHSESANIAVGVEQQSTRAPRRIDDPGVREERVVLHAVQEAGRIRRMREQAIPGLFTLRVLRVIDTSVDVALCYVTIS